MASEQAAVTKSKEEVDKVGENLEVTDNENIQDKPSLKDKLVKAYKFLIRNQGTISLLLFALVAIYALCAATPMGTLYRFGSDPDSVASIDGVRIDAPLKAVSPVINNALLFGLIGILISLFYKTFRNNSRRIYYPSNHVYEIIHIVWTFFVGGFLFYFTSFFSAQFSSIRFDIINAPMNECPTQYLSLNFEYLGISKMSTSTSVPALGIVLGVVVILVGICECCTYVQKIYESKELTASIYGEKEGE
ncbi:MAG: hypothetical protein J6I69_02060 [Bacilli bacterium]|nr:hypothetical protein [Bacilli bacterium]